MALPAGAALLAFLFSSGMLQSACATGNTPAAQRAALLDLWNGLAGLSTVYPDWASGDPCVNGWTGVVCYASPATAWVPAVV